MSDKSSFRKRVERYGYALSARSTRYICPGCGRRSFTPYVDSGNKIVCDGAGRCDREVNCGYHKSPKELGYSGPSNHMRKDPGPTFEEPDYIPKEIVSASMRRKPGEYRNSLRIYLHRLFDGLLTPEEVDDTLLRMGVGDSKLFGGSPIFWQMDSCGYVRTGKIMGYNPDTGKRIKKPRNLIRWIHKFNLKGINQDFTLRQVYFNSHGLRPSDDTPIALFESEKASLIFALTLRYCGAEDLFLPMATGGISNLNPTPENKRDPWSGIQALKGRKVILFPDEGCYEQWSEKGKGLRLFSKEVWISSVMEPFHPDKDKVGCAIEKGDGFDDLLIRYIQRGEDPSELILTSFGLDGFGRLV